MQHQSATVNLLTDILALEGAFITVLSISIATLKVQQAVQVKYRVFAKLIPEDRLSSGERVRNSEVEDLI